MQYAEKRPEGASFYGPTAAVAAYYDFIRFLRDTDFDAKSVAVLPRIILFAALIGCIHREPCFSLLGSSTHAHRFAPN